MGRPAKDIDADQVRKLAKLGRTQEEIADFFGVAQSVISERFQPDVQLGRAESKISLRRMQWKAARAGSVPMAIHLGKVHLGLSDKLDVTSKSASTVVYIERAKNERDAELDGWAKERVRALTDRLARENGGEATALHFEGNGFGNPPNCLIVLPAKEGEATPRRRPTMPRPYEAQRPGKSSLTYSLIRQSKNQYVRQLYARLGPEEFYRRRLAWLAANGRRASYDRLIAYLAKAGVGDFASWTYAR